MFGETFRVSTCLAICCRLTRAPAYLRGSRANSLGERVIFLDRSVSNWKPVLVRRQDRCDRLIRVSKPTNLRAEVCRVQVYSLWTVCLRVGARARFRANVLRARVC